LGKGDGIVEKQSRGDPKGRLAHEVNGGSLLKELPEIVDTAGDDEEAAQAVGHGVETADVLQKKDVEYRYNGIEKKDVQEDPFGLLAGNDLVEEIELEGDDQQRFNIVYKDIVDMVKSSI
jgi:hypothetical protein